MNKERYVLVLFMLTFLCSSLRVRHVAIKTATCCSFFGWRMSGCRARELACFLSFGLDNVFALGAGVRLWQGGPVAVADVADVADVGAHRDIKTVTVYFGVDCVLLSWLLLFRCCTKGTVGMPRFNSRERRRCRQARVC